MMNDELDEIDNSDGGSMLNTRTLLWNVEDLENPVHVGSHIADVEAIDHNLYVRGNLAYLANYCSGLRILDSTQVRENHTSTLEKKPIQRRPPICAMVNRSTRIFVQILLSTERNGLLLSKIPPLIVQLGPYNRSIFRLIRL